VDLHRVRPRFLRPGRGIAKGVNQSKYLFFGKFPWNRLEWPHGYGAWSNRIKARLFFGGLPPGVPKLGAEPASVFMYFPGKGAKPRYKFVVVQGGGTGKMGRFVDSHEFGNIHGAAVLCPEHMIFPQAFAYGVIRFGHTGSHCRHDDTVTELQSADRSGRKKSAIRQNKFSLDGFIKESASRKVRA
jgi:hypothetical protein